MQIVVDGIRDLIRTKLAPKAMRAARPAVTLAASLVAFSALAQDAPKSANIVTPDKLSWKPNVRTAGTEAADIMGDSTKTGPFVQRVKFPPHFKMAAHYHPEDRTYTIVSGTWYVGYGDKFDETKLILLPAGSFYVEPANTPHFVMTKDEEVVFQVTGVAPSKTIYVEQQSAVK